MRIPERLLQHNHLGRPSQYFPARRKNRRPLRLIGGAVFLAGCFGLGFVFWQGWVIFTSIGPLAITGQLASPLAVSVGLGATGAALLWATRPQKERGILVCTNGLRALDGNEICDWPWAQISEVYLQSLENRPQRARQAAALKLRLVRADGCVLQPGPDWPGIETLAEIASQQVGQVLLERQRPAFAAGEVLSFGPLKIQNQRGIWIRGQWTAWRAIHLIRLSAGIFAIHLNPSSLPAHKVAAGEIPNLNVLLALCTLQARVQITDQTDG